MPNNLSIPNTFIPFTKIVSAQVNANFAAVATFLNITKLTDDNLQDNSITPTTKLIGTGGTAGQFLGTNGTNVIWISSAIGSIYNVILGSASQVSTGIATNSTFASIVQADGQRILVLPEYATVENWTVTKKVLIQGLGATTLVDGSITFTSTSDESQLSLIRCTGDITLNIGADSIHINNIILASTKTFVDNGTGNLLEAIQE